MSFTGSIAQKLQSNNGDGSFTNPVIAADFPDPQTLRDTADAGMADDGVADLPDHLRADLCDGLHALARALDRALAAALPASDQLRGTLPRTAANKSGTKPGTKAA